MTLVKDFNSRGFVIVKHHDHEIFKKLIKSINLILDSSIDIYKLKNKYSKFLKSNLNLKNDTYSKIFFLKNNFPSIHGKIYKLLQRNLLLSELYNDKNITNALQKISKTKFFYKMSQLTRLDLSPDYHHALPWHQDAFDNPEVINHRDCLTIWTPLTKLSEKTGGLEVIERSHITNMKQINHGKVNSESSDKLELKVPLKVLNKNKSLKIKCNIYESVIMSMSLVHKTFLGTSKGLRITALSRYMPSNSISISKILKDI